MTLRELRDQADAHRARSGGVGFHLQAEPGRVLVGLATPTGSLVLEVPAPDGDTTALALRLADTLGFPPAPAKTAMQKLQEARAHG